MPFMRAPNCATGPLWRERIPMVTRPADRVKPWAPAQVLLEKVSPGVLEPSRAPAVLSCGNVREKFMIGAWMTRLANRRRWDLVAGACLLAVAAAAAQERRLPEQESFLRDTAARLQTDSSLQSSYVYVETRREQKLDEQGQVNEESVKVYESYPGLPGEDRWEMLIARNGQPRPAAEVEKEDRDRLKKAEGCAGRLAGQAAQEKAGEERELTKRRREFQAVVDDIF